jgi:hypothetical protein
LAMRISVKRRPFGRENKYVTPLIITHRPLSI